MLGSLILCLKGMRIMMFQLSGYYCRVSGVKGFSCTGALEFRSTMGALRGSFKGFLKGLKGSMRDV